MKPNFTRFLAWLGALFLIITGAKLWIIQVYGTAIPYWDQWDEAGLLFKPWLEGHLTAGALFAPHNEHRIFFTRVLDLFVVWLNRQWDPTLQMVINAFIHAGYACGLAYCLWIFTGKKNEGLLCFLLVPFFALPFAAENTIHGFQSQMYFLSIFSLATIVGMGFGKPGGGRWFFGLVAAVMSLFTMGSGLLASLAIVGLVILRILKHKRPSREALLTLGCSLVVFVTGVALNVTVAQDKQFQADSPLVFLDALMRNLAWPFRGQPVMLFFTCLPLAILAAKYFRSDFKNPQAAEFILTLAFWGLLQSAGLAYGRAGLGGSSRYLDTLGTIPIASVASWFILAENTEFRRWPRHAAMTLVIFWVGILFWGLAQISRTTLGDYRTMENYLQWSRMWGLVEEENVRAFISTDDPGYLSNQPLLAIPYWSSDRLIGLLRNPKLLAIMPPACRPSLKLEKDEKSDASFILGGCPPENPNQEFTQTWGSYATKGAEATGSFVSKPISATLPKLIIPLCCGSSMEGISVQLVEQPAGRKIKLCPETTGQWHTLIVTAPKNPFRLEINDQNHKSWVAVGEIKELGRLSYDALLLLNHALAVLAIGLCLMMVLTGFAIVRGGISRINGDFAGVLVLLVGLVSLVWVWSVRNFTAAELAGRLHKNWAVHFAATGDPANVEMHLREALWLQPDDPETLHTLANIILHDPGIEKNQARQQAVLYDEAALRLNPDYTEARQQLHEIRLKSGRQDATGD